MTENILLKRITYQFFKRCQGIYFIVCRDIKKLLCDSYWQVSSSSVIIEVCEWTRTKNPPLFIKCQLTQYMSTWHHHLYSWRVSKTNFFNRKTLLFSFLTFDLIKFFGSIIFFLFWFYYFKIGFLFLKHISFRYCT